MDDTDLTGGHLEVGEVYPSGEMDTRPVWLHFPSVYALQLHILCSLLAFDVMERLSAAQVESKVDDLYLFSQLNGVLDSYAEDAAIASVLTCRSRT